MPARRVPYLLIPILFVALSVLVTYPTAARLSDFTVFATDSLLEAWTLHWDVHAILGGPSALLHLWDANIIFPYLDTLAFSEHLLAHALLLLPFTLLGGTPMVAANLGVLYTTFLSGLGMYLLVAWLTGDRRAGIIAGVAFAAASFRIGHIIQLHLLSTHWMPFAFLAAARLVKYRRNADLLLLILFTNLQFFSALNYIPVVGLGLAVWLVFLLLAFRQSAVPGLAVRLVAFALVTAALNWPVFQVYQRMSQLMGITRTLGDARVYGASLATYVEPIANSLLYVRGLGLPYRLDSAFPGVVVVLLALTGLVLLVWRPRRAPARSSTGADTRSSSPSPGTTAAGARSSTAAGARSSTAAGARSSTAAGARSSTAAGARSSTAAGARSSTAAGARSSTAADTRSSSPSSGTTAAPVVREIAWLAASLAVLVPAGFCLSFGANELALGESLAPLLARLLPYPYLFDWVPFLQGFRVPARFALLTMFGLAALAGIGFALLRRRLRLGSRAGLVVTGALGLLLVAEHLAAPLPGVAVPYGGPVYDWLATAPRDGAVIELPYYLHTEHSYIELDRVYQSVRHWRRLVNGTSGFKPAWMVQLGRALDAFPDWRSFDLLRRLGVRTVVLHRAEYDAVGWGNVLALLPGYLSSVESVHSVSDDLILSLRAPALALDAARVLVDAASFPTLTFTNRGPATFVADPLMPSWASAGTQRRQFAEPLFVSPGVVVTLTVPLDPAATAGDWAVTLGTLGRTLRAGEAQTTGSSEPAPADWQPVGLRFADGSLLQAVALAEPAAGGQLAVHLRWQTAEAGPVVARAELNDRFGRLMLSQDSAPLATTGEQVTALVFPLAETVPPGRCALHVRLLGADGTEIAPIGADGRPLDDLPGLPVVVRPAVPAAPLPEGAPPSAFANGLALLGITLPQPAVAPGDWVRFTLHWRADRAPVADVTVFTQFLGSDGRVWGQRDNPPVGGWYPTSLWLSGEVVADDYAVRLDPAAPPGDYRLIVGMYDPATGVRVGVASGPGHGSDFVPAATVAVGG